MNSMQTLYLRRCLRNEFVTLRTMKSMRNTRLTSVQSILEGEKKCKSAMGPLYRFLPLRPPYTLCHTGSSLSSHKHEATRGLRVCELESGCLPVLQARIVGLSWSGRNERMQGRSQAWA